MMVPQQDSLQGTREAAGNGEGEPVYGGGVKAGQGGGTLLPAPPPQALSSLEKSSNHAPSHLQGQFTLMVRM